MAQQEDLKVPEGWVCTSIGDISDYVQRGKGPKYTEMNEFPVVNQKAVRWFGIQEEHLKYVSEEQWEKWTEERFIREGDILWNSTGTGTIGRACYLDAKEANKAKVVDSHVTIVRSNCDIKSKYVFYWIMHPAIQGDIAGLFNGSTNQVELSKGKVLGTELPLAPLPEQKRIVEKLDSLLAQVDTIQQCLNNLPDIIKRFRQSVLAAAVSGKLTEQWREGKKFDLNSEIKSIHESRKLLHDSDSIEHLKRTGKKLRSYDYSTLDIEPEGRDIPPCWKQVKLGEILSYLTDYHANGSYEVLKEHVQLKEQKDYACMIRATNFEKNNFEDLFVYISKDAYDFLGKSKLYGEEILVGKIGNAGSVYFMPKLNRPASLAMNLFSLRFDEKLVNPKYLYLFLTSVIGDLNIQKYVRGVATKSIDKKSLRSVFINYTSFKEQIEIVRLVEQYFALADTLEKNLANAKQRVDNLTQSILAKAFRGELVPQDPNDEPADKLLLRIKAARIEAEKLEKAAKKAAKTSKVKKK